MYDSFFFTPQKMNQDPNAAIVAAAAAIVVTGLMGLSVETASQVS
jgi:hypothetical protein